VQQCSWQGISPFIYHLKHLHLLHTCLAQSGYQYLAIRETLYFGSYFGNDNVRLKLCQSQVHVRSELALCDCFLQIKSIYVQRQKALWLTVIGYITYFLICLSEGQWADGGWGASMNKGQGFQESGWPANDLIFILSTGRCCISSQSSKIS
jgi:hypothetical protein